MSAGHDREEKMDTSALIARFIGPVMLAAGISMFVNRDRFKQIFRDFSENPGMIFMAGVMALTLGVTLVTFHNIWVADWRVFITAYGWLALFAGIIRMIFPEFALDLGKRMMEHEPLLMVTTALSILIGAFLTYMGFIA